MAYHFDKYFTPEEAEAALPLVKKIVADILKTGKNIKKYIQVVGQADKNDPSLSPLLEELNGYHEELENLGCFFKDWDYEVGLVDFPARIEGEVVFLCWKSDEESLGHYHSIEEGFAGRKSLAALGARHPTQP